MIIYNRSGEQIADVVISDDAQRYQELGGDDYITLRFDLAEYVNIPLYAYIVYDGIQYTIYEEPNIKKFNNTHYEYTIRMLAPQGVLTLRRLRNSVDYRLEFPFTGTAAEHLSMILAYAIQGWEGLTSDPSNTTKTINYSYNTLYEAIQMVASAFNLGLEFDNANKMVYLGELDKPISYIELSYGSGNGLLPGIIRKSYNGLSPIGAVYAQGGSRNIDASVYGSSKLLLPKGKEIRYDGKYFEGETGYIAKNAQEYVSDITGHAVSRLNLVTTIAEGVLDCTEIYPHRESKISSVVVYNNEKYFIVDNTIPSTLNYADYLIAGGGNMTIVFQSGELAGREFEVKYYHNASGSLPARRFEIIAQDIDGITMPGGSFVPAEGDRYAVFNVALPDAYIADDATKTGASWDMFKKCVRYLHENSQVQYTIDGEIQPGWSERQWSSIKSKVVVGGYVRFTDVALAPSGIYLQISTIKHSLNKPYAPKLSFASNAIKRSSVRTSIDRLSADVSALQVANYRTSQSSRVSAQILGDRIDDIEGGNTGGGGGGGIQNVEISNTTTSYLSVSDNSTTDTEKKFSVGVKTAEIAGTSNGLATAEDVRGNIAELDVELKGDDTYVTVIPGKQTDGTGKSFKIKAITATMDGTGNGLAKAEDIRPYIQDIGEYKPLVSEKITPFANATTLTTNLAPNTVRIFDGGIGITSITLTVPSSTVSVPTLLAKGKDNIYVFRYNIGKKLTGINNPLTISVVSDSTTQPTIRWKGNTMPTNIILPACGEVVVKMISTSIYLCEWSAYTVEL